MSNRIRDQEMWVDILVHPAVLALLSLVLALGVLAVFTWWHTVRET